MVSCPQMRLVSGGCSRQGRLHGRVELAFSSGEELRGVFSQGRRSGQCVVTSREKGIR